MNEKIFDEDERFMKEALKEALKAQEANEIPVGAVIVCKGIIIARAHNYTERLTDVTAHAEMQAYTSAANYLGGKYLKGCTLYVTLEPCVMCAGGAFWTQMDRIVYGATDSKRGFLVQTQKLLHPKTQLKSGVMEAECSKLLIDFFRSKRER